MKTILKFVFTALLFLFLFSCTEDEKNEKPYAYVTQVFDYQYAPGQHAHLAKKPDWVSGEYSVFAA